jgi:hypothetical protein
LGRRVPLTTSVTRGSSFWSITTNLAARDRLAVDEHADGYVVQLLEPRPRVGAGRSGSPAVASNGA